MLTSTVALLVLVSIGTLVIGVSMAWLVSAYRFPGRSVFRVALVLPLAMPGYILGYVFMTTFSFAGPVQSTLRDWFDTSNVWFPNVRSLPGAARGAVARALSLRLRPDADRPAGTGSADVAGLPHPRPGSAPRRLAGGAARRPADAGGRSGAGDDGGPHRLRHRPVLQRRHAPRRHLQGVEGRGQPRRRHPAGRAGPRSSPWPSSSSSGRCGAGPASTRPEPRVSSNRSCCRAAAAGWPPAPAWPCCRPPSCSRSTGW